MRLGIFSDNCESPFKTVVYIGQRCVYWVVYEASCRVNWTDDTVYFITYNTGTNIHAPIGTNLHNGSSFCKHRWEAYSLVKKWNPLNYIYKCQLQTFDRFHWYPTLRCKPSGTEKVTWLPSAKNYKIWAGYFNLSKKVFFWADDNHRWS